MTLNNQMQVGLYFLLALRKAMTKRRILYVIRVPKLPERPEHSKISGNQLFFFFQKFLKNSEISFLSVVVMENIKVLLVQVIYTAIAI